MSSPIIQAKHPLAIILSLLIANLYWSLYCGKDDWLASTWIILLTYLKNPSKQVPPLDSHIVLQLWGMWHVMILALALESDQIPESGLQS
jgi:hypothetical protein